MVDHLELERSLRVLDGSGSKSSEVIREKEMHAGSTGCGCQQRT